MIKLQKAIKIEICIRSNNLYNQLKSLKIDNNQSQFSFSTTPTKGEIIILESKYFSGNINNIIKNYENVILIMDFFSPEEYNRLYNLGVSGILRSDFVIKELEQMILTLIERKTYYLEKSILENIFQKAQNSIVITDKEGNIEYANKYFQEITKFSQEELIKNTPKAIKSDYHESSFYEELWDIIQKGNVWEGVFINKNKYKELFYEESTITPILNSEGNIVNYLKIGKNVTRERMLLTELSNEVKVAQKVMESMIPNKYNDELISFECHMEAYNYLGGDFIHFEKLDNNVYRIALLDVMGHGVSSALIGLTIGTLLHAYNHFYTLEETIKEVNTQLVKMNNLDDEAKSKYVTGIFIQIDFDNNELKIINAGHPDLYLTKKDKEIIRIESNNLLLGVLNNQNFNSNIMSLDDLRSLFLYSDGLLEINKDEYVGSYETLEYALKEYNELYGNEFFNTILNTIVGKQLINDDIALCRLTINK